MVALLFAFLIFRETVLLSSSFFGEKKRHLLRLHHQDALTLVLHKMVEVIISRIILHEIPR